MMVTSTSASTTMTLMPVFEKLVHGNHVLWKAQVLTVLRRAQLAGFLNGTNPAPAEKIKIKNNKSEEDSKEVLNPAFDVWKAQEQQVLSYFLTSVSRDVLAQVAALLTTATVWKHIKTSFASQSRA
jgi:hypothetical protein